MRAIVFIIFSSFSHTLYADDSKLISGDYSIYNINTGILVSAPSKEIDEYVYGLSAYYVDKYATTSSELGNANWSIKESSYGSGLYIIKNAYSGLCLSLYGVGYQPIQTTCSSDTSEQLWKLTQHQADKGTFTISGADNNSVCLYSWPGNSDYYLYTDECSKYPQLSDWAFISPIRRGYHNP
ncbi:hypothetical protein BTN33_18120 [Aeromonas veronii]|uniref:RICIN domain-containing protein n=1 Tax=Aeromonas veronii TaxID=654 RepID=UPI000947238E|nr:RICIN domain-containing protein [Aeromonas veronii]OLF57795.1 hypothetical protein BTN33_18120 [Aeromonas veronii]